MVLTERYQYNRNAEHRFVSHSMAKSIVGIAAGWRCRKEDRFARRYHRRYVPDLAGNPYGETTIRNMLRMASGVPFQEVYDGKDDLANSTGSASRRIRSRHCARSRRARPGRGRAFTMRPITVALTLLLRAVTGTSVTNI